MESEEVVLGAVADILKIVCDATCTETELADSTGDLEGEQMLTEQSNGEDREQGTTDQALLRSPTAEEQQQLLRTPSKRRCSTTSSKIHRIREKEGPVKLKKCYVEAVVGECVDEEHGKLVRVKWVGSHNKTWELYEEIKKEAPLAMGLYKKKKWCQFTPMAEVTEEGGKMYFASDEEAIKRTNVSTNFYIFIKEASFTEHFEPHKKELLIREEEVYGPATPEFIHHHYQPTILAQFIHSSIQRHIATSPKARKIFYCYFLMRQMPIHPSQMSFLQFLDSIFYIGKGRKARVWEHLIDADRFKETSQDRHEPKVDRILELWKTGGVILYQPFIGLSSGIAHSHEAAMIEAYGLKNLTNKDKGVFQHFKKLNMDVKLSEADAAEWGAWRLHSAFKIYQECWQNFPPITRDEIRIKEKAEADRKKRAELAREE